MYSRATCQNPLAYVPCASQFTPSPMEFHAVILCGPGRQLSPLSKVRATGTAKALLPLALVPMFEYVLDWCEQAFFPKIMLACSADEQEELQAALEQYKLRKAQAAANVEAELSANSDNTLQFTQSIQVAVFDTTSNGNVLRQLVQQSEENSSGGNADQFVVLPCDFITDLPPQVLIEAYRCREDSDMGMLVSYHNQLEIEDKKNKIFPKCYTLCAELPSTGHAQIVDYYSSEDVDFQKALSVRTLLAWKQPNISISRRLFNSSIFFGDSRSLSAFFQKHHKKYTERYFSSRPLIKIVRDLARKSWQSRLSEGTIGIFIIPDEIPFIRANNLPVYMEANRHFLKIHAQESAGGKPAPKDKTTANVGADSIVAEGTTLGERTNVKRSVVGTGCVIGRRVKLTGCVILDGVSIGDDVLLENTIVGNNAVIHNKAQLVNCNVESTHEVAQGTHAKGDTLLCLSLEGLVYSDDESSSDNVDDSESSYDDYEAEDIDDGLFGY